MSSGHAQQVRLKQPNSMQQSASILKNKVPQRQPSLQNSSSFKPSTPNILDSQQEMFKLHPQKCFKVGGYTPDKNNIQAHRGASTLNEYDACLLIGQLIGVDLI